MAVPSGYRELERLVAIQHSFSRNYFRLLAAHRHLNTRAARAPKSFGTMLADAMEAERRRLGRELHSGVGQSLAGIHLHVSLIEASMPNPPAPVRKSLDRIASLAGDALEQVRGVSRPLYVPAWQAQSLREALRSLWEASGIPEKFAAALELQELSMEPPPELRRALYLTAQEGISNIIQHANARRVRLSLTEAGGRITLAVEDDGAGFGPAVDPALATERAGIGLRSLHDMAGELGGELHAGNSAQGSQLIISFPVNHE